MVRKGLFGDLSVEFCQRTSIWRIPRAHGIKYFGVALREEQKLIMKLFVNIAAVTRPRSRWRNSLSVGSVPKERQLAAHMHDGRHGRCRRHRRALDGKAAELARSAMQARMSATILVNAVFTTFRFVLRNKHSSQLTKCRADRHALGPNGASKDPMSSIMVFRSLKHCSSVMISTHQPFESWLPAVKALAPTLYNWRLTIIRGR